MGQAKRRGSFEVRRAQAIARQDAERAAKVEVDKTPPKKHTRIPLELLYAMAVAESDKVYTIPTVPSFSRRSK